MENKVRANFFRSLCSLLVVIVLFVLISCGKTGMLLNKVTNWGGNKADVYLDENMDFGALQTVALMPLANMAKDQMAAERVRDVLFPLLLSTGAFYVLPPGEVVRGITRAGINNPSTPSAEEIVKLGNFMKVDAIITGAVREYGEIRSGATEANVISLSLQMIEAQTGRVVWASSSTQGGVSLKDRLLGGGGSPMNEITEKAIYELIDNLFWQEEGGQEKPDVRSKKQPPGKDEGKSNK